MDESTGDRRSVSLRVIEAVAAREGVDPIDVEPPRYEPLYDVCSPEALDALFAPRPDGTPRSAGTVRFPYCGYVVTVGSDGTVTVSDPD